MSDAPRYIYIGVGDDGWYVMHPDEKDDADYIYIRADYYEREHEEAERLRRILLDFRALAVSMPMTGITSKNAIRWIDDALAARKGVRDE